MQPSSCFPASPSLSGSALSGQLTQQGEAIANFHATIQLPGTGTATNPLNLVGDLAQRVGVVSTPWNPEVLPVVSFLPEPSSLNSFRNPFVPRVNDSLAWGLG